MKLLSTFVCLAPVMLYIYFSYLSFKVNKYNESYGLISKFERVSGMLISIAELSGLVMFILFVVFDGGVVWY